MERVGSTLARLVARVGLVNHVDLAAAAHHLAVRVTLLGGFNGGDDFHKRRQNRVRAYPCQPLNTAGGVPAWICAGRWRGSADVSSASGIGREVSASDRNQFNSVSSGSLASRRHS